LEQTLLIVKPDAVSGHHTGDIVSVVERDGFIIMQMRMLTMDNEVAARLYAPHRDKPFFEPLLHFMTSGPVVACVLQRDDAVARLRSLLGDTDSRKASPGTIRALYGTDKQMNAAHGSDSEESFLREAAVFFEQGTY
jgi:nucleoside-diphosphate kinase